MRPDYENFLAISVAVSVPWPSTPPGVLEVLAGGGPQPSRQAPTLCGCHPRGYEALQQGGCKPASVYREQA
jgi:hypothetical protein